MFSHYIKTALRNIRGNWVYSILSICCLAIGTAMFSALFYGVNYDDFFENRLPLRKRSALVYYDMPDNPQYNSTPHYIYRQLLPFKCVQYLDMPEIEYISVYGGITHSVTFQDSTKVYGTGKVEGKMVYGDFFRYWNLTLLYGDRVPQNVNEVVVTESLLKRMGYDKDISQCVVTDESFGYREYQIVNVVRDDKWSRSLGADVFYSARDFMSAMMPLYNIDVVLRKGGSIDEVNKKLSTVFMTNEQGKNVVPQLADDYKSPEDYATKIFISIMSMIVLLVAVTNFLKHTVMLLKQRNRSNIIRYSIGASPRSLTNMLVAEVLIILACSLAVAVYISFYICTWLNQTVFLGDLYFHLTDLYILDALAILCVGAVCAAVCRLAVDRQNKVLRNRIVVAQREKKALKYIVIGIETSVAVLALASVMYLSYFEPKPYNPLSKSESRRTFFVESEEGYSSSGIQLDFYNRTRALPEVEDMVSSEHGWDGSNSVCNIYYLDKADHLILKNGDLSYFRFFNIPVEWFGPVHPSSGYLIYRNSYERLIREGVDVSSIEIKYSERDTISHFVGIFDELMCNDPSALGMVNMGFRYEAEPYRSTNFFVRFHQGVTPAKAELLLRKTWSEANPESIEDIKIRPVPKYTGSRLAALGFKVGGMVCILLVILSVSSSISAETNIRRKEVALRKINGAKARNIMELFIRPYGIILIIALLIGNLATVALFASSDQAFRVSLLTAPITLLIMALVITLTVFHRIRVIMRTNPADVIKSE